MKHVCEPKDRTRPEGQGPCEARVLPLVYCAAETKGWSREGDGARRWSPGSRGEVGPPPGAVVAVTAARRGHPCEIEAKSRP